MFNWSNNCGHQAIDFLKDTRGISLGEEFTCIDSPYKACRLIRPYGSISAFLNSISYLDQIEVKKARIGDLMVFDWGKGMLHFSLAINSDGITSIGPCEHGNLFFKTLEASSAFKIWQDQ